MLKKAFIYLIIAAIFVSGNGLVLAIHTCFSSSTTTVSLFEDDSCGGKHSKPCHDENDSGIKSQCCHLQYSYYKLDLPSVTKKINVVDFFSFDLITPFQFIVNPEPDYFSIVKPPLYTIDIPILFSQLLI